MEKSIKALFIELERVAADLESLNNPAVIKEKTSAIYDTPAARLKYVLADDASWEGGADD